jgi:hypothetical protein
LKLLPHPRVLERRAGWFVLPGRARLGFDPAWPDDLVRSVAARIRTVAKEVKISLVSTGNRAAKRKPAVAAIRFTRISGRDVPPHPEFYALTIDAHGVRVECHEVGGVFAAVATLRQLLREFGRCLPRLHIRDWPDFSRRGVMLDVSRGRVPRLETLLGLVEQLADFKFNEFQLYTEHTFAYRKHRSVWRDWGALTGSQIRRLDTRCRELGMELVPNQNSFGHLREWLADPRWRPLAEVAAPWPDAGGAFLRRPATLAPANPETLPFLRGLYDELLPNFTSRLFNVGCDETWDLGRGQSKELCRKLGKGRVYLRFLKQLHRELAVRHRRMMFWGDIILHHPQLVRELPRDVVALDWGYEAGHPFARETAVFRRTGIPFYVCPGTSTWMTLIGRHDNAFANLREAAAAGRKNGASGFLVADWGDGGHPQPLAVSYLPYLLGGALAWCAATTDERLLVPVASRDVFRDRTGRVARAALALGLAHRKLGFPARNLTPLGAVIAAPPPEQREVFCHEGLTYYLKIGPRNVRAALAEIEAQRSVLRRARPATPAARMLKVELDLAARMAGQSCQFMLWQQAVKAGRLRAARGLARRGMAALQRIDREFAFYWPARNQATPKKCAAFLRWRIEDYRQGLAR